MVKQESLKCIEKLFNFILVIIKALMVGIVGADGLRFLVVLERFNGFWP